MRGGVWGSGSVVAVFGLCPPPCKRLPNWCAVRGNIVQQGKWMEFDIVFPHRLFQLRADSADVRSRWLAALGKATFQLQVGARASVAGGSCSQ